MLYIRRHPAIFKSSVLPNCTRMQERKHLAFRRRLPSTEPNYETKICIPFYALTLPSICFTERCISRLLTCGPVIGKWLLAKWTAKILPSSLRMAYTIPRHTLWIA